LSGAKKCLIAFRPIIVFEFMGHSGESIDIEFKKFNDFFNKHNYMLLESKTKKKITLTNINTIVPPAERYRYIVFTELIWKIFHYSTFYIQKNYFFIHTPLYFL
jgi:hypothetical protein